MSEDIKKEEKIIKVQLEKNIEKEEAKKEVAQKSIEEITGKSAIKAADEVRQIIEVTDAKGTANINKEKRDTSLSIAEEYKEKIEKNKGLADDLVKTGLGSEQLSVTDSKLTEKVKDAVEEMQDNGEGQNQTSNEEQRIAEELKRKHPDLSDQKIQELSKEIAKNPNISVDNAIINKAQNKLLAPPQIPPMANSTDTLENASVKGAQALAKATINNADWIEVSVDVAKNGIKAEKIVANTAGEVAGTIAEKGTEKVLGKGAVGKIGGKVAKTVTKDAVATAVLSNLGGLGK